MSPTLARGQRACESPLERSVSCRRGKVRCVRQLGTRLSTGEGRALRAWVWSSAHRKAASAHRGGGQRRATGGAGVEVDGTDGGGGAGRWGGGPRHHRAVHDLKGRAVGPLGRVLSRGRPNESGGWSGHEVPSRGVSTLQRIARRLAGPRWSRRRCLTLTLGRVGGGECHCACVPPVAPPRRAKNGAARGAGGRRLAGQ